MKSALLIICLMLVVACTETNNVTIKNDSLAAIAQEASEPDIKELIVHIMTISHPDSVELGEKFNISWRIESSEERNISHTAVHYATSPVEDPKVPSDYTFVSKIQSGIVPNEFSTEVAIETFGTIYFRSHVVIDGKHYWSEEKRLTVKKPAEQPPTPPVRQFTIEVDDDGFYPGEPINVKKGERVFIDFIARKENVYYGGMQVKSTHFDTGKINKGEKASVDFVAFDSFTMTSYWPASGVKKATMQVNVDGD